MQRTRIGIVFGGRSGEHEISVRSATSVISEIDRERFEIIPIAISPEGHWLGPVEAVGLLPEALGRSLQGEISGYPGGRIALPGDTGFGGLTEISRDEGEVNGLTLDVVFPVLHGTFGEDGTIQGLLEMSGIPYVGCGVLASACGMDKVVMKALFRDAGLPQCRYVWFLRGEWEENESRATERIEEELGYPCFVKPANLGSSVGVSIAMDRESLRSAVGLAAQYDRKIIIEENLEMREIECGVIGNDQPEASLPGEYVVYDDSKKFLDFNEKYEGTGNNRFVVPALISDELTEKIRSMAKTAFKAVDGAGFARVDFFLLDSNQELLINEINTIPGLTDASGFPMMWKGTGREFRDVIEQLVDLAFERHRDRSRNKTSR